MFIRAEESIYRLGSYITVALLQALTSRELSLAGILK